MAKYLAKAYDAELYLYVFPTFGTRRRRLPQAVIAHANLLLI